MLKTAEIFYSIFLWGGGGELIGNITDFEAGIHDIIASSMNCIYQVMYIYVSI